MTVSIRDRSGSTPGTIQRFGAGHIPTSDASVAQAGKNDAYTGDGANQGNPSIPDNFPAPEVSQEEGEPSSCSADAAGQGGGSVKQTIPALGKSDQGEGMTTILSAASEEKCADKPATAFVTGARVASHPGLMQAHQRGSVNRTHDRQVHGKPAFKSDSAEHPVTAVPQGQHLRGGHSPVTGAMRSR